MLEELWQIDVSPKDDGKFVDFLLMELFDVDVLRKSSFGGGISNYNKVAHIALDPHKLNFITGTT